MRMQTVELNQAKRYNDPRNSQASSRRLPEDAVMPELGMQEQRTPEPGIQVPADEHTQAVRRVEAEFARVLRQAVSERKFGQFGVIVSLQSGAIKTFQTQSVETLK